MIHVFFYTPAASHLSVIIILLANLPLLQNEQKWILTELHFPQLASLLSWVGYKPRAHLSYLLPDSSWSNKKQDSTQMRAFLPMCTEAASHLYLMRRGGKNLHLRGRKKTCKWSFAGKTASTERNTSGSSWAPLPLTSLTPQPGGSGPRCQLLVYTLLSNQQHYLLGSHVEPCSALAGSQHSLLEPSACTKPGNTLNWHSWGTSGLHSKFPLYRKNMGAFWFALVWFGLGAFILFFFSFYLLHHLSPSSTKKIPTIASLTQLFSGPSTSLCFNTCLALLCSQTDYETPFGTLATPATMKLHSFTRRWAPAKLLTDREAARWKKAVLSIHRQEGCCTWAALSSHALVGTG